MGRLRKRLDGLESHAHGTMTNANEKMEEAIGLVKDFILDLQDGMSVKLVRADKDDATIRGFLLGTVDELPLKIVIDISDDA